MPQIKTTTWNRWTPDERATYLRKRGSSGGIYDRCAFVGPKMRATTWDEAHAKIRASWPEAQAHGSVNVWHWTSRGAVNASPEYPDIVAEAWPVRGSREKIGGEWWFRVLTPPS